MQCEIGFAVPTPGEKGSEGMLSRCSQPNQRIDNVRGYEGVLVAQPQEGLTTDR